MPTAAEQAVFGQAKKESGPIGFCQVCRNKAELQAIPGDSRSMCGDCAVTLTSGMKRRKVGPYSEELLGPKPIAPVASWQYQPGVVMPLVNGNDEKRKYLEVIRQAEPGFIDKTINEIVSKKILHFDFNRIIENDRWFSVLDLRRMALDVDPDFEKENLKPVAKPYLGPPVSQEPEKQPSPKKGRRKRT